MKITCISDLHGNTPKLEGGDLLIIAGDLTRRDRLDEYMDFSEWAYKQDYKKIVIVAGNHDGEILKKRVDWPSESKIAYLEDSGIEFEGVKIWGSPWTLWFQGINPRCAAFTRRTDTELEEYYRKIPLDTDILVTHNPPYGTLDCTRDDLPVGSPALRRRVDEVEPKLHVFGHIHEAHGWFHRKNTTFMNVSVVNEDYEHVNPAFNFERYAWTVGDGAERLPE